MKEDGTMTMTPDAFMTLAREVSERDVRNVKLEIELKEEREKRQALEASLQSLQAVISKLQADNQLLQQINLRAVFEASCLRHYLVLSTDKIAEFVKCLESIENWCLLHAFLTQVLPEDLKMMELARVDEILVKPQSRLGVTMDHPTFHGPMYDVSGNNEVNLGQGLGPMMGATAGAEKGGDENGRREDR